MVQAVACLPVGSSSDAEPARDLDLGQERAFLDFALQDRVPQRLLGLLGLGQFPGCFRFWHLILLD